MSFCVSDGMNLTGMCHTQQLTRFKWYKANMNLISTRGSYSTVPSYPKQGVPHSPTWRWVHRGQPPNANVGRGLLVDYHAKERYPRKFRKIFIPMLPLQGHGGISITSDTTESICIHVTSTSFKGYSMSHFHPAKIPQPVSAAIEQTTYNKQTLTTSPSNSP